MPDSYFFNNSKAEIYYQDNHFNIWKFPSGICRQTTIYWWQSKALTKCPFTFLFHQVLVYFLLFTSSISIKNAGF